MHLLNCIAEFVGSDSKSRCGNDSSRTITSPCQRLTADMYPGIINNYYMKPSHKKPYYYIINHNTRNETPTNSEMDGEVGYKPEFIREGDEYRFYVLKGDDNSRVVNQSVVKIEIHSGSSQ